MNRIRHCNSEFSKFTESIAFVCICKIFEALTRFEIILSDDGSGVRTYMGAILFMIMIMKSDAM